MNTLRAIFRGLILIAGLLAIYYLISSVLEDSRQTAQQNLTDQATTRVANSYVSLTPFGEQASRVPKGSQIFYNMQINRVPGENCYVRTSWRWLLRLPSGAHVMWNHMDGEFFAGDQNELLSQTIQVPEELIPGDYTLSRLSIYRCGDDEIYSRVVRNLDLVVS